jgi:DNA-directed RNA polymerase specialized sigma24 family protein
MPDAWPASEVAEDLYRRLADGDPVASSDLAVAVLDPLTAHLQTRHPRADPHACATAAGQAILDLIRQPAIFDPTRGGLLAFLRMSAERDLLNLFEAERRHHRNREYHDSVEPADGDGNQRTEAADDLPSLDDPALAAEIASLSPDERTVFDLIRDGEKATAVFATALGLDVPADEQARAVKRIKDRVVKRLQRAVAPWK